MRFRPFYAHYQGMEPVLLPMTEETGRLLRSFRAAREKMERAAERNELTEALCLLPPVQRVFESSMTAFRERMAALPELEEKLYPGANTLEPLEFSSIQDARRVTGRMLGSFSAVVAAASLGSFALGFWFGRGG